MSEGRSSPETGQTALFTWIIILLLIVILYLNALVGYLVMLTVIATKAHRSLVPSSEYGNTSFLVLIPAHNEERLLPGLLQSLANQLYPASLVQVHVVADNCTDRTADVASQFGVQVHVRTDLEKTGKGFALNWLLEQLGQEVDACDAILYLDADSLISPSFLRVMAFHLAQGERAIQAYYSARDPEQAWTGSLRYAALAVLHYLRPLGRTVIGASVGLKGNGMVFATDLMRQHNWSSSLTEDIELHMALLLAGERVTFAPDAVVWGEIPSTLANSASQHMRWEQGRRQMAKIYNSRLLHRAWQEVRSGNLRTAFRFADAMLENLIPPFSILAGLSVGVWVLSIIMVGISYQAPYPASIGNTLALINLFLSTICLVGQAAYLFTGLRLVHAPAQIYRNLLYVPLLIVWKTWQYILMLTGQQSNNWIRTKRNEG